MGSALKLRVNKLDFVTPYNIIDDLNDLFAKLRLRAFDRDEFPSTTTKTNKFF
jgi:hypothetical protein